MKIVHINLHDIQGGAARIANMLAVAAADAGHEVHYFARVLSSGNESFIKMREMHDSYNNTYLKKKQEEGWTDLFGSELFSVLRSKEFANADIIHLHSVNGGYFSYFLLPFLASKKIIWTLHDTLVATAACLYPQGCDGWRRGYCASCPADSTNNRSYQRETLQKLKTIIFSLIRCQLVAPSKWIEYLITESNTFLTQRSQLIYNGINVDTYKPYDKKLIRARLGLPFWKKIVMFAAQGGIMSAWKGGEFAFKALHGLSKKNSEWLFLHIGADVTQLKNALPIEVISRPFVNDEDLLAKYYAAADVFLTTSLSESFGLTVCEAMACGTPVVAFASGALPEIIDDGLDGFLLPRGDVAGVEDRLNILLNDEQLVKQFSVQARDKIVKKFNAQRMLMEYLDLYEKT